MKKAYTKRKSNHATFMYIPECESKVVSLRIPLWVPKAMLICLVLLIAATSVSFYMLDSVNKKYDKSKEEISTLAAVNNAQKQEIEKLQQDAIQIQKQLEENIQTLNQIKEIVGIEKNNEEEKKKDSEPAVNTLQNAPDDSIGQLQDDSTGQLQQIKTAYKELSVQLLSQRELMESSIGTIKKQVAYLNAKPSIKPVNTRITASYGYRKNPFTNRGSEFHKGIDFAGSTGTPIKATGDGVVIFAGWQSGYGKVVIISHGYGLTTLYGHNSKLLVEKGDKVKKGQVISKMGSTGRSTGPHLHYEVRLNGKIVNPSNYF